MRPNTSTPAAFAPQYPRQPRSSQRLTARRSVAPTRRAQRPTAVPAGVFRVAAKETPASASVAETVAQRLLLVIRVAMGIVFVACGVRGLLPAASAPALHDGAMAFGSALLLAGSLLPLLKGSEVIVETLLQLGTRNERVRAE
jgi:hypothetical protein